MQINSNEMRGGKIYLQPQLVDGILFSFERDILSEQRTNLVVIRERIAVTDAVHKADGVFLLTIMFIMHNILTYRRRANTFDTGNGRSGHYDAVDDTTTTVLFQIVSFLVVHPVVDGGLWRMFFGDQDLSSFLSRRRVQ